MDVRSISLNRLLKRWHWLCSDEFELVDVDEFGDLFLQSSNGPVLMLDVHRGELKERAGSVTEFDEDRSAAEDDSHPFLHRVESSGDVPKAQKLYGYKLRPFTADNVPNEDMVYVTDLYEYLGYIAELENQLGNLPEGTKVKVVVKKSKSNA